jgi:hypothetical protein
MYAVRCGYYVSWTTLPGQHDGLSLGKSASLLCTQYDCWPRRAMPLTVSATGLECFGGRVSRVHAAVNQLLEKSPKFLW